MRLIDADALKKKLFYFDIEFDDGHHEIHYAYKEKDVDDAPTIDAVEVVRCKDCKYWDKTWTNSWAKDYHYCSMVDGVRKVDFYCADAERRSDE